VKAGPPFYYKMNNQSSRAIAHTKQAHGAQMVLEKLSAGIWLLLNH
jgi:hypothetical protein